jgi:hypothetical protein
MCMPKLGRFFSASLLVVSASLAACVAPAGDDPEVTADGPEEELRALSASEILGDLAYGQTSAAVSYTKRVTYRAFRFQGAANDRVDAWVRSADGGDARAFLLDDRFRTIVENDDAAAGTRDARVSSTLPSTGTYYVAFRDSRYWSRTFTVSLAGVTGAPASDDPFEPSSCSGAPMTRDEAIERLGDGSTWRDLGSARIVGRSRRCNAVSGCPAWDTTKPVVVAGTTPGSSWTFPTPTSTHFALQVTGGDVALRMWSDQIAVADTLRWQTATCKAVGAPLDCAAYGDDTLWVGTPAQAVPWSLGPKGSRQIASEGVLTNRCFRMARRASFEEANGVRFELEIAYLGRF